MVQPSSRETEVVCSPHYDATVAWRSQTWYRAGEFHSVVVMTLTRLIRFARALIATIPLVHPGGRFLPSTRSLRIFILGSVILGSIVSAFKFLGLAGDIAVRSDRITFWDNTAAGDVKSKSRCHSLCCCFPAQY